MSFHRLLVLPVLLTSLAAQRQLPPPQTVALAERFAVVQREPSGLWGFGAGYRAHFAASHVEFLTCSAVAEPPLQVTLSPTAVGRGAARQPLLDAEPQEQGLAVRYHRGAVVEVYDVRPQGMEQSFVFHELPAGEGDLVVDLRLDTVLPLLAEAPDRLEFGGDHGGVTIAGVVGIDAAGDRVPGRLSFADGVLSLRLPAAFVQTAALPLVLDPLLAPVTRTSLGLGVRGWDAAHDLSTGTTLFAWFESVSSNNYTLKGWFEPGGPVVIRATALLGTHASVANIASRDAFVVAWSEEANVTSGLRSRVLARALTSPNHVGPETTVQVDQNRDLQRPRLGSNTLPATTPGNDAVLLAYHARNGSAGTNGELGDAVIRTLGVGPTLGFAIAQPVVVSSNATAVGLSRSNIASGNFLVTWGETNGSPLATLSAQVCTVFGTAVTPEAVRTFPTNTGNLAYNNLKDLVADGDGDSWSVFLTGHVVTNISNENSTWPWLARCELQTPTLLRFTELVDARGPTNSTGRWPSIGTTPSSVVCVRSTVYRDPCTGGGGACDQGEVRTHARVHCQACEPPQVVGSGLTGSSAVVVRPGAFGAVAESRREEIQLVGPASVNGVNVLHFWTYRVDDGTVVTLGGGCGNLAATARVECATVGGARCDLVLEDAPANRTCFLLLGIDRLDAVGCGSCRLVPNPFTALFAEADNVDDFARTDLGFVLPNVPALRGLQFFAQWLVDARNAPPCASFPFDLSNGLQVTIQ